jgi:esterase/lipase superfamily enzyme
MRPDPPVGDGAEHTSPALRLPDSVAIWPRYALPQNSVSFGAYVRSTPETTRARAAGTGMSRVRRSVLVSIALLSLLAAAVGGYLYYQFYAPTGAAVRHAESFQYRRVTVARPPGAANDQYRYFYATNRNTAGAADAGEDRFGNGRMEKLSYGYFDVRVEPSLGLGMLVNPTQWLQNEEIQLDAVSDLDRAGLIDALRAQVERSPYQSLLVVVHGYRESFPTALRKTAFLGHILDLDTPVLVFDWPGDQGRTLSGYRRARTVAEASGTELAEVLRLAIEEIAPQRLWLLANSMGAQVAAEAFAPLMAVDALADAAAEFENVIFTAPDVDQAEFDDRFEAEIMALARQLTVYVSSNDRALLLSRIVNRSPRQGESGLSPDQLSEALQISNLVKPGHSRVALVDVTPVNRTRNFHNFSLETPEFFDDLYLRLTNRDAPASRVIYPFQTAGGEVYWVLTRSR